MKRFKKHVTLSSEFTVDAPNEKVANAIYLEAHLTNEEHMGEYEMIDEGEWESKEL